MPCVIRSSHPIYEGGAFQTYQYFSNGTYHQVIDPSYRTFTISTNTGNLTQTAYIYPPQGGNWTKKSETVYIADNNLPYLSNLRVQEERSITPPTQIKKVTFSYIERDGMWLVKDKDDYYDGTVYRRTETDYTSYPAQYLLGLPRQISVYGGAGAQLLTRFRNSYDETTEFTDSNGQTAKHFINAAGAIQHDNTNYGFEFTARGNLTSVKQYWVDSNEPSISRIVKRISYDTNGNLRAETDAALNRKQIEYTDNYSNKPAGLQGATAVYPYTTADPTGFRAGAQWN